MPRLFLVTLLTASVAACGAAGTEPAPGATGTSIATATETASEEAPVSRYRPLPGDPAVPTPDQPDDAACGAAKLGRWLNVLPTETVKAEIAALVGERPIRYYAEGDPITMDFNPARLNVELGEDGRIKRFRCG